MFPRLGVVDGDDVLARDPMTGERDIRSEDRQLLLDAIGAATEKLVITYTGANEYSGQPRPPAVPLAELLDTLDMTTPEKIRKRIVVEHPLQPFDIRNVIPGKLVPDVPFSFDPTVLRAAQVSAGERSEHPKFISGPLPPPPADDVILADLIGFFKDPVKGFFRALEFTLPRDVDGVARRDARRHRRPRGVDGRRPDARRHPARHDRRSSAPSGVAPRHAAARPAGLAQGHRDPRPGGPAGVRSAAISDRRTARPYDVDIELGGGRRLTGTVSPVYGERLVSVTYSKLDGKHLLESWIPLLALFAHDSRRDWSAVCIGRPKRGTTPRVEGAGPPGW